MKPLHFMVKTMVSMVSGEDFPNKTNETSVKNVFFFMVFLVSSHYIAKVGIRNFHQR